MSCKELIESLKKASDQRIKSLWSDAEDEGAKVRLELAHRLKQLREDLSRKEIILVRDRSALSLSEADRRARIVRLLAEKALSERLYAAAKGSLGALRNGAYKQHFSVLVQELPSLAWQIVRVHPEDAGLARKHFPGAQVVADAEITGGMDVSTQDGAIRIINTFEKRLERAWGEMEPGLIRQVYEEVTNGSAAESGRPGVSGRVSSDEDQRQTVSLDR